MIAFGGAAPLHAGRLCEKLGIARLLVPPGAGVGSAIGFLRAPLRLRGHPRRLHAPRRLRPAPRPRDPSTTSPRRPPRFVRSCDAAATILTDAKLFMRYKGQGWEIPVALDAGPRRRHPTAEALRDRFTADYAALFGRAVEGLPIEITVWAVNASTPLAADHPRPTPVATGEARTPRAA